MIEILKRMLRSPQGALGLVVVGLILLVVIVGPWSAPYDPEKMAPLMRYKPPSAQFWLGTDQYGRDILSRLLHGARATVVMAVLATALGTLVGAIVGTVSAFLGGRGDEAIMRTVDAIMSIPSLLLALLIVNLLGKSSLNALLAIALAFAPGMARVTRSVALAVRKQDYVNAAIARGESAGFIVGREMLPNVVAPIIVEMTIRVAFAVTDGKTAVKVSYDGLLPDLFREGQGVVTEGVFEGAGRFRADSVLAKHDETYMPREVADTLKKQGHWQGETGAAAPARP